MAGITPAVPKPEPRAEAETVPPSQPEHTAGASSASPDWKDFYRRDVRKAIGRRRPLLNAASLNQREKVAVGVFSIPKRKRSKFRAVTEVHYHNACNELARFLIGQLAFVADPGVSKYLTYSDFEKDMYKFHKARIEKLKFEKLIKPEESFTIAMKLQRVKKAQGRFYAQCAVSNAVTGNILYSYNPDESV